MNSYTKKIDYTIKKGVSTGGWPEHTRNYKKQYETDISLLCYSIIDPQYIFYAKTNIRGYFRSNKITPNDKTELIILIKTTWGKLNNIIWWCKIHILVDMKKWIKK